MRERLANNANNDVTAVSGMDSDRPYSAEWLQSFKEKHGRLPRVLHIGNIANNAYNNAKLLNRAGVDCDVICYNYYHIMGCPEWEDADFEGDIKDQFYPNWTSVNLNGFKRPKWFAQGPLVLCIYYLIAKRDGRKLSARLLWSILEIARFIRCSRTGVAVWNCLRAVRNSLRFMRNNIQLVRSHLFAVRIYCFPLGRLIFYSILLVCTPFIILFYLPVAFVVLPVKIIKRIFYCFESIETENYSFEDRVKQLVKDFAKKFSEREDKLTKNDLVDYKYVIGLWRRLFSRYDIVQAYATDPVLPMLANNCLYIGFEHGTLRDFTLCNSTVCRNTSLSYNIANHVFITNGDCLEYAKKIGVTKYSPMLHPFDEEHIRSVKGNYNDLHEKIGAKYLFLCTLRHDWKVKGTDIYIRALPKIAEAIGRDFRLIMTGWGAQVSDSKSLALELNVSELIQWIEPLQHHKLFRMQKSVDILFDQIALPHFGATAPEGIAAGVPVIMSYDPAYTAWIIPEPAPILSAWNEDDVVENVKKAIDSNWLKEYRVKAKEWIDKYHNSNITVQKHIETYFKVLNENNHIKNC